MTVSAFAFALLLSSAAAGGSVCSSWRPSAYDKDGSVISSDPGSATAKAPCRFGQDAADGGCDEGGKHEPAQANECECVSAEVVQAYNSSRKTTHTILGAILLPIGILLAVFCRLKFSSIEECCRTWNDNDPCKPKWDSCRTWHVCWAMGLWPMLGIVGGIAFLIVGATADVNSYLVSCGNLDEDSRAPWM